MNGWEGHLESDNVSRPETSDWDEVSPTTTDGWTWWGPGRPVWRPGHL